MSVRAVSRPVSRLVRWHGACQPLRPCVVCMCFRCVSCTHLGIAHNRLRGPRSPFCFPSSSSSSSSPSPLYYPLLKLSRANTWYNEHPSSDTLSFSNVPNYWKVLAFLASFFVFLMSPSQTSVLNKQPVSVAKTKLVQTTLPPTNQLCNAKRTTLFSNPFFFQTHFFVMCGLANARKCWNRSYRYGIHIQLMFIIFNIPYKVIIFQHKKHSTA